jgi:hypothetical protein
MTAAFYCTHYLPPLSLTPVANLPPVSTSLAKLVEKFAAGVTDTGGKVATGVVDTGSNFATGVVDTGGALHLDLRLSPRIFEKFENTLGLGGS